MNIVSKIKLAFEMKKEFEHRMTLNKFGVYSEDDIVSYKKLSYITKLKLAYVSHMAFEQFAYNVFYRQEVEMLLSGFQFRLHRLFKISKELRGAKRW
jgi:hypothetical protein